MGNPHTCIILLITGVRLKAKLLPGLLGDTVPAAGPLSRVCLEYLQRKRPEG